MVRVQTAGQEKRFLLDTAATSILNLQAFSAGKSKRISVTSWSGSAATSAREVTLSDFKLGNHTLHDWKLPAIDLSPIGKACHGEIDGILGVGLPDRFGVTIDLQRKVASLKLAPSDSQGTFAEMGEAMHHCDVAFNEARAANWKIASILRLCCIRRMGRIAAEGRLCSTGTNPTSKSRMPHILK